MASLDQSNRFTDDVDVSLVSLPSNMFLITASPSCRLQLLCLVEMESHSEASESDLNSASFTQSILFLGNSDAQSPKADTLSDADQFMNCYSKDII